MSHTFKKQRECGQKKRPMSLQDDFLNPQNHQNLSNANHLLQRWQELKEREHAAHRHNKQLLQQFEKAQDTLREMMTLNAAMKTIRMEYERYLEEHYPQWQQQLEEKTQAAQRKRMENLETCSKNAQDGEAKSCTDRPLQNSYIPDGSPYLPYMHSSWQMHPQSQARNPIRESCLPFQLHHFASMSDYHNPWLKQNPPGRSSLQPACPWSWAAGAAGIPSVSEALWGHLNMQEPPAETGLMQVVREEVETRRAPSSKRERGSGSRRSRLSQELDIQPVRLSSCPAESSESSRELSQVSGEKRKKREKRRRLLCTSSDRERCSSRDSSKTSSASVTAAVLEDQSSESAFSSEEGRTHTRDKRKSAGPDGGIPKVGKAVKERIGNNGGNPGSHKEETQSSSAESMRENAGEQSHDNKSESSPEESGSQRKPGSVSTKIKNGGGDLSSSSEESSVGEKDEEKEEHGQNLGEGDGETKDNENSRRDEAGEEEEEEDTEDDVSERKPTPDEVEETGEEDEGDVGEHVSEEEGDQEEKADGLKNDKDGTHGSEPSEEEDEGDDEDEGEGEEDAESDEEQRGDAGQAEESDSDDSIISPQNKCNKLHIIREEAKEDDDEEEGSTPGHSDEDSSDDDIEHLLSPPEQLKDKEEKDLKAEERPKAFCDKVETERSTKTEQPSDSEEFDHFYD